MIEIYLQEAGDAGATRRSRHGDGEEVTLGAADDAGLRVASAAHRACCVLWVRAAGCFVVDRAGDTTVNGKPIRGPRALYREDRIELAGGAVVFVEHVDPMTTPIERAFLADIRGGDLAAREVYADWLDEQGDPRRAEFLRLEDFAKADPGNGELARRLSQLAVVIDLDWRIAVGRGRVERCSSACGMDWGEMLDLVDKPNPRQRRCPRCINLVRYCERLAEAGGDGPARVVIDASIRRVPGDL